MRITPHSSPRHPNCVPFCFRLPTSNRKQQSTICRSECRARRIQTSRGFGAAERVLCPYFPQLRSDFALATLGCFRAEMRESERPRKRNGDSNGESAQRKWKSKASTRYHTPRGTCVSNRNSQELKVGVTP